MFGIILLVVGLIFVILNFIVVYPFISCFYAPLAFWLLAILGIAGGILSYFDIKLFSPEE
jgi:hypothetical protein